MKNCSKTLLILTFLLLNTCCIYAEDIVTLDTSETFKLQYSNINNELTTINQDGEIVTEEDFEPANHYYLDKDDEIFEGKLGKIFSKFIDEKIINNKINNFSSSVIEKF